MYIYIYIASCWTGSFAREMNTLTNSWAARIGQGAHYYHYYHYHYHHHYYYYYY